ncbi:hypothetical protein [Polaromonas sp.]|uniref:hypothetical protein n=1 Tax=Polaromonas sp. TaxID=1869339 RepID=UPI00326419D2
MSRNKHIRPDDVDAIVNIIRGWSEEKISWNLVCEQSKLILGYRPGRQGLSAHKAILMAFQARKTGLKQGPPPNVALPSSLAAAAHRLNAKDAEIRELKTRLAQLNQQFVVWLYNTRGRLTMEQLNRPLPLIDRSHTG